MLMLLLQENHVNQIPYVFSNTKPCEPVDMF